MIKSIPTKDVVPANIKIKTKILHLLNGGLRPCINKFNALPLPGFKINQTFVTEKIILLMATSVYKWLSVPIIMSFFSFSSLNWQNDPESLRLRQTAGAHPFHVSTTEINHNAQDKTLEITCRIFTNDFETILKKNYPQDAAHNAKVDLSAAK